MLRQQSSRNQRTKGFRVKHALQICLLVAVCVWLLYQVKHSHDKKRAFEERNSKILNKVVDAEPDFFKFGRKDIRQIEVTTSENEIPNKEEENEESQEEEEQETKQEEIEEEEGRGAGDDEIDEQDQEKADEDAEHVDELSEEEEKDGEAEQLDLFDSQDHEGGSQEAREENYKRDDASSAVVHDTRDAESESGNGDARSSDGEQIDTMEKKDAEIQNAANGTADASEGNNDSDLGNLNSSIGNETMPNDNLSMNGTAADNKEPEVSNSTLVGISNQRELQTNSTTAVESENQSEQRANSSTAMESNNQMERPANSRASESNNQIDLQNNHVVVGTLTDGMPPQNNTILDSVQGGNAIVDNGTPGRDEPNFENVVEEHTTTSSTTKENGDLALGGSDDSSHITISDEEREVRTDLSTLPDIQNEVQNVEDEAAE